MTKLYLAIILVTAALPAAAQTSTGPVPADTARHIIANDTELVEITKITVGLPPFTTIQPALSRVAGVQYTPFSGAPGAWAAVRIRGIANVTGSSQPLYVVDGVPVYNTEITPSEWTAAEDFFTNTFPAGAPYARRTPQTPAANPLLDLPVEDVDKVEIIKGAAATARYGMQGTNGVIAISTRQGADRGVGPQPLRVRYAAWAGVQQVRQRYELLGARPYAELVNAAAANAGYPTPYSATDLHNLRDVDRQDQVLRLAGVQSHHLSADGLHHRTRYYVSADYLRQTGVVEGSDLSRYHLRANLEQQLTARLRVGLRASASQTDEHFAGTERDQGPLLQDALLAAPLDKPTPPGTSPYYNDPLYQLHYLARSPRTRRLLVQLNANYQFSDALSLSVRGSREQADARQLGYSPEFSSTASGPTNVVETQTAITNTHNWVAEATLRYQRTFGERHAVTAALTYLRQQYKRRLERKQYTGVGQTRSYSDYQQTWESPGLHSPSASLGYTYAGRYEVQASLRTDLVLKDDHSLGEHYTLPGGQLSWHLNKEAFLANAAGLSDLTLWAGAGKTSTYFTPDRTTHYDAGLRLGILGGRLTLDAGAYERRTRHAAALLTVALPFSNNGQNFYYVAPDVLLRNRGLELSVSSTWRAGQLIGTSQLAAATNHNLVEEANGLAATGLQNLKAGQPLGQFYVFDQDGTYPAGSPNAGQVRFRDRNGDGQVNYADGYYQGSGLPRYMLSFYQQLHWQRFELASQFDGLFGYQLLNYTLAYSDSPTGQLNSSPRALGYWTPTHQDTDVPQPGTYPSYLNSKALESGNHVRLSQLTLSYEVLATGPRRASVWVGGQNLFVAGTYRGFDPNVSGGGSAPLQAGQDPSVYPVARVWQVGVRAAF
jgi:TonB-dependent SusC/RagA subfamily outer membrane receptor